MHIFDYEYMLWIICKCSFSLLNRLQFPQGYPTVQSPMYFVIVWRFPYKEIFPSFNWLSFNEDCPISGAYKGPALNSLSGCHCGSLPIRINLQTPDLNTRIALSWYDACWVSRRLSTPGRSVILVSLDAEDISSRSMYFKYLLTKGAVELGN